MQQWLHELVKRRLGYEREWRERVAAAEAKDADEAALLESAWAATKAQFVVADVETTGLKPESAELLELAALVVESDGTVVSEFSALVRVPQLPKEIVELTGITLDEVRAKGRALDEALSAFLRHIADRPVFFHNAPFDHGFLKAAEKKTGCAIRNKVHDTLPLARQAWPGLRTYRLASLSQHVNGTAPRHRALADARATLDVLLAARRAVGLA